MATGYVLEDATYCPVTGELVEVMIACPICEGRGRVSAFRYATPRRR